MPALAHGEGAHVAWSGVCALLSIAFGLLHATRGVAREHGALAGAALAQLIVHLVALAQAGATTGADAAFWQGAYLAGVGLTAGAALEVMASVTTVPSRERVVGWSGASLCMFVGATGLGADAAVPAATATGRLGPGAALAAMTPAGELAFFVMMGALAMGAARATAAARHDPLLRPLAFGALLAFVPIVLETRAHLWGVPEHTLPHHARGIVLVVMAVTLVGRAAAIEQALARKSEEASASAQRLAAAQAELSRTEQLAAVGELSAVIAHEIRNPLAILRNAVSGLRRDLPEGDRQTLLRILDEEVDRLDRLLDDLLVYSRPLAPETREIDLRELVQHAVRLALEGQPTARGIDVAFDAGPDPVLISGDPALLRHALINIVDNAILAMPRGGTITVRIRPARLRGEAAGYAIEFRDEGEGMDTLVRSRATDPFFTTRETGTGLGLAIVERVARVHGGEVGFESHGGLGTTVTLSLPSALRASAVDLELQTGRFSVVSQVPDRPRP